MKSLTIEWWSIGNDVKTVFRLRVLRICPTIYTDTIYTKCYVLLYPPLLLISLMPRQGWTCLTIVAKMAGSLRLFRHRTRTWPGISTLHRVASHRCGILGTWQLRREYHLQHLIHTFRAG